MQTTEPLPPADTQLGALSGQITPSQHLSGALQVWPLEPLQQISPTWHGLSLQQRLVVHIPAQVGEPSPQMQIRFSQVAPVGQGRPQPPQLALSEAGSTQASAPFTWQGILLFAQRQTVMNPSSETHIF